MADIDYGEAWDFIDDLGRPLRLRFRRNWGSGDRQTFDGTGQLLAVIDDQHRSDNADAISISRPDVLLGVGLVTERIWLFCDLAMATRGCVAAGGLRGAARRRCRRSRCHRS
ncbi:hypothetical protein EI067_18835 [Mycobacterium paragordonae]|nr:hypothetical protein EI067_18835 [Mycobacterium paragordonae]